MDADLDTLCIVVYCTADDLLPERPGNARRRVTDAEVVTLCVAQAIMGIPSDRRFLAVAAKRLGHLFPGLPGQPAYFKRRRRLADTIEWLLGVFASQSPGFTDDLLLIDSHPGRVRAQPRDGQALGARRGRRLRLLRLPLSLLLGLPAARPLRARRHPAERSTLASPKRDEREVGSSCSSAANAQAARRCSATRATPAATSPAPSPTSTPRSSAPGAKTSPGTAPTSRRSANGSSRSSGPAKTCSPSNATAPAPSPASANASSNASSASPPASPSTTDSAAPAAHSSTTSPEPVESTHLGEETLRLAHPSRSAVDTIGGLWEEIDALLFEFLSAPRGVLERAKLDWGCSTGRSQARVLPVSGRCTARPWSVGCRVFGPMAGQDRQHDRTLDRHEGDLGVFAIRSGSRAGRHCSTRPTPASISKLPDPAKAQTRGSRRAPRHTQLPRPHATTTRLLPASATGGGSPTGWSPLLEELATEQPRQGCTGRAMPP